MNSMVSFDNLILLSSVGLIVLFIQTRSLSNNIPITSFIVTFGSYNFLMLLDYYRLAVIIVIVTMFCNAVYAITKYSGTTVCGKIIHFIFYYKDKNKYVESSL